jgi:hypothetical protein
MGDERGCRRVAAPQTCHCVRGSWPNCGAAERCGPWEAYARRLGYVIIEDAGLIVGHELVVAGCEPVIFLPDWAGQRYREREIAYLIGNQWVAAHGWPQAAAAQRVVLARLGAEARYAEAS